MKTDHQTLIELLATGELSEEQRSKLFELAVADESVADEIVDQMWLEPWLKDSFSADSEAFVRRIESTLDCNTDDSTRFTEQLLDAWSDRTAECTRRRVRRTIGGVVVAVVAFLSIVFLRDDAGQKIVAATFRLQHSIGSVSIVAPDGTERPAESGVQLRPGETLTTRGDSSAVLSCSDGTILTLIRDGALRLPADRKRRIVLNSGAVVVRRNATADSVVSIPESTVLETPHGTLEVPHAELLLAASNRQTDVSVTDGHATLKIPGESAVRISRGQCAIAKTSSLELRRGSATPDEWSEDFETGIPDGWVGHLIEKDLPTGSSGAVGTARSTNEDGEDCHQIWSASQWEHGLAVVHADTHLNFVYRFKQADRVQILALLRPRMPDLPKDEVQILQPSDVPSAEQWWNVPSGKWHVASVPLRRFSNPATLEHPQESSIATAFNFRPQDHACGLVIDRMWLSREPVKDITFKPLAAEKVQQHVKQLPQ